MESNDWKRNLYVCLFGSVTTVCAMTLLLPFLPIYVAHLGVKTPEAVVQWSGVAFGATFFGAGITAPLWGKFADRFGRRPILIRASLGMAIAMSMLGLVHNVYQLVLLRLLAGVLGGYYSGAVVLVATQTPRARVGWALGMLSSGALAGNLIGPLIGGVLPGLIGIRQTFFAAGAAIFVAFIATVLLIREAPREAPLKARVRASTWSRVTDRPTVIAMLLTALMLMLSTMSIEPIITVFISQLTGDAKHIPLLAGLVMSATACASMLAAPHIGRLADRIGAWPVLIGSLMATALLMLPQAFIDHWWQLLVLRFLMGITLSGLMPSVTMLIRHNVPDEISGTVLSYSTSAQYTGNVCGPLMGGFLGAHGGLRSVFIATGALLVGQAALNWSVWKRRTAARSREA